MTLVNDELPAGTHMVTWNGRDQSGDKVTSGVYFYQLEMGEETRTQRMVLLK